MTSELLWQPPLPTMSRTHLAKFLQAVNERYALSLNTYSQLHEWSVHHSGEFWKMVWDFCGVIASQNPSQILQESDDHVMQHARWFKGASLNFAENLLRYSQLENPALIFISENGKKVELTYAELHCQVANLAGYFKKLNLQSGDRVAGCLSNCPETIIAMLATASLGAVWCSCSPDFGEEGLYERFGQIEPKILLAADAHCYNGKTFHHLAKIKALQNKLPSLVKTIIVPSIETESDISSLHNAIHYSAAIKKELPLHFTQVPFDHPLYILFSSGTTGKPKCMVHSVGGTLIQHLKELILHTDLKLGDKIFFYTTCGWMMWNWFVSSLAVGATLILYEGSPFYPTERQLFDLIDQFKINVFGVSAKFLETCEKRNMIPNQTHQFSSLRTVLTTGSSLLPDSFNYVYHAIKKNVQLSSISGGSDIISCFALGNPLLPVYTGELQCIGLGMNVKIFNEAGESVVNQKGELVCVSPFPSMPVRFWNDPEGEKYHQAYFEKFNGVWTHGDYAKITSYGSVVIYGRSDATLNAAGIRIGTAEIYHAVEKIEEIVEPLAITQRWDKGERIVLFALLKEGINLDSILIKKIKDKIRQYASPHHVPAKIIQVSDLPRTLNGKLAELAVKKIVHGEAVNNVEALANPEALDYFKNIRELSED